MPVLQVPAGVDGGPGGLLNILKEDEKEDEKKEDKEEEEEMEGKWRDEEEMYDSLVVEEGIILKFLLPTCILPIQILLQGSFCQEEVKQPQCRDVLRPIVMNYITCRLPPCLFSSTVQPLW